MAYSQTVLELLVAITPVMLTHRTAATTCDALHRLRMRRLPAVFRDATLWDRWQLAAVDPAVSAAAGRRVSCAAFRRASASNDQNRKDRDRNTSCHYFLPDAVLVGLGSGQLNFIT